MAIIHPFRAIRPRPELAEEIACVPYDVINSDEARQLAEGRAKSFLHIIRPEIDLEPGTSEYADEVYRRGANNLQAYVDGADSVQEEVPSLYVYRLIMDGRSQTGVFGCAAVSDYDSDVILKHEKTRPSKEDDRTRHILEQRAHAEPIMLTFRDHEGVDQIIRRTAATSPLYDFVASDGVQHTLWKVAESSQLVEQFEEIEKLYVADGHHRCKAASRAAAEYASSGDSTEEVNYFPAVFFPMSQMQILPYNRIIRKLPDSPEEFRNVLRDRLPRGSSNESKPTVKGEICVYLNGQWSSFQLPSTNDASSVEKLDVGLLTKHILEPLLDIRDPRTDENIDFVGGIRGAKELERLVDSGQAEMAVSMYPTSIEELLDVSDDGLLMPPKSTWFEPKLRSGLLVHLF